MVLKLIVRVAYNNVKNKFFKFLLDLKLFLMEII